MMLQQQSLPYPGLGSYAAAAQGAPFGFYGSAQPESQNNNLQLKATMNGGDGNTQLAFFQNQQQQQHFLAQQYHQQQTNQAMPYAIRSAPPTHPTQFAAMAPISAAMDVREMYSALGNQSFMPVQHPQHHSPLTQIGSLPSAMNQESANFPRHPYTDMQGQVPAFSHMFPSLQAYTALMASGRGQQQQQQQIPTAPMLSPVASPLASFQTISAMAPSLAPSKKRSSSSDDDSAASSSNQDSSSSSGGSKRERLDTQGSSGGEETSEMGLGGESRLKINFSCYGTPGKHPQVFGKSRLGVPDGLCGTYVLYSERWKSEIMHEDNAFRGEDGTMHALITWRITNLTSGVTQSRTETPKEAMLRHKDGRTLCNKVFRRALEQRAREREVELASETNPIRHKTIKNLVRKLRPKHFSEGPLVFGLRHETVQNKFKAMTRLDADGHLITVPA